MYPPLLVYTDLDGTLLDHHSYSYSGASEALERLHRLSIPLILTSSKTKAELLKLQTRLGLQEPFIAENGGGIFLPRDFPLPAAAEFEDQGRVRSIRLGLPYSRIRTVFARVRPKYNLRGFGDMSVEELMTATGLPREDAVLAGQRDFSEPFIFLAQPRLLELQQEVAAQGLTVTRGGRFYHLMAAGQDKGRAVIASTRLFQTGSQARITTVGLGDARNDYPMLKIVDIPVLIPKPDGSYENMDVPAVRKAPYPGSRGWGASVAAILDELERENNLSMDHRALTR